MFIDKYNNTFGECIIKDLNSDESDEGTTLCSGVHSGSLTYSAWRAFSDDDKNSDNQSSWCYYAPGYIGFIFNKPKVVNVFSLRCSTNQTNINGFPKDFTFEASNDGENYVVLDKITEFEWDNYDDVDVYFTNKNNKRYKYYKVNIQNNRGYRYLQIKRVKFFTDTSLLYHYIIKKDNEYYSYNNKNIILLGKEFVKRGITLDDVTEINFNKYLNESSYNILKYRQI